MKGAFMEGLTPGRIVHYVATGQEPYTKGSVLGQCKAATVVGIADSGVGQANIQVMWDGYNDLKLGNGTEIPPMTTWIHHVTNDPADQLVGTWHYPRECQLDH